MQSSIATPTLVAAQPSNSANTTTGLSAQPPQDTLELWGQVSTIVSNILLSIAAIVGIRGLNQWHAELTGKAKFEIARKIALLAFQFRHEFLLVRDPFTYPLESKDRERDANESPQLANVRDEQFVRGKRLIPLQNTLKSLNEASWEAEILLGKDSQELMQPIQVLFKEFFIAFQHHFRIQTAQATDPNNHESNTYIGIVYGMDNDFSKSIDATIKNLVEQLKPYLR